MHTYFRSHKPNDLLMPYFTHRCLLTLLLFTAFCTGYSATIKGVIADKSTGETIISATVALNGNSYTALSGLDGSFVFRNLPAGVFQLSIRYVGYKDFAQSVTLETDKSVAELSLSIEQDGKELDEVVVIGAEDVSTDGSAYKTLQLSDRVMNVVSAKAIEISPDVTVANVVQRVSGISIERNSNGDGQFAIIRGMDKRYNYTLVNGVKIPSPDDKYRYVPLDIFPAELLDRLEVTKSLTPNMEGDAVGGVVNMVMKNAPESPYVRASVATGYSELFMGRRFMAYDRSGINALSPYEQYGKTYYATPANFPAGRITYNKANPPMNLIGSLALGNRFLNKKLGLIVAGSYQNTFRGSNSLFFNTDLAGTESTYYVNTMNERQYSEEQQRYGLHSKIDYKPNRQHKFFLYSALIGLANIQTRDVKSTGLSNGFDPANGNANLQYSTRSRLTSQQIFTNSLQGEHVLHEKIKVLWSGVYSMATNKEPDNTTISLLGQEINFVDKITYPDGMARTWSHNADRDLAFYLHLSYDAKLGNIPLTLFAGGLYRDKQRSNLRNSYGLSPLNASALYGTDFYNYSDIQWRVDNPRGSVANALTYDASENIAAGYFQFKFELKKLHFLGGARVENTNQGYSLAFPVGEDRPSNNQVYTDVLPSLHIKYTANGHHSMKLAYFRSINRPGFFEIVPFKQVFEEYTEKGNPDLQRATADNVDLRYEIFPGSMDMLSFGIFYKYLQNPIEYTIQSTNYFVPGNFGNATNYGFEVDFVKYFRWLGIKANYTYTHSSITTPKWFRIKDENNDQKTISKDETRPLQGQSAHIGNLSLLLKDVKSGLNAQLSASYTGERIYTVSLYYGNDFWQQGFVQVDASVEKTFFKYFTIFLKANNLLNTPLTVFIKNTNSKNDGVPYQTLPGKTLVRQDYYLRSYMVGLRVKL